MSEADCRTYVIGWTADGSDGSQAVTQDANQGLPGGFRCCEQVASLMYVRGHPQSSTQYVRAAHVTHLEIRSGSHRVDSGECVPWPIRREMFISGLVLRPDALDGANSKRRYSYLNVLPPTLLTVAQHGLTSLKPP